MNEMIGEAAHRPTQSSQRSHSCQYRPGSSSLYLIPDSIKMCTILFGIYHDRTVASFAVAYPIGRFIKTKFRFYG